MRVLIVTDCPVLRDALCLFLGEHGIDVVAVADDISSLKNLAATVAPDAVLVDWRCVDGLDGGDGALFAAESLGGGPSPLVIGLCGARDGAHRDVAGVHAWSVLGDPPAQLMAVLVEAMRAWRACDGESSRSPARLK